MFYNRIRLPSLALLLLLGSCANYSPRSYLGYSLGAIERRDWQAAYRLMNLVHSSANVLMCAATLRPRALRS